MRRRHRWCRIARMDETLKHFKCSECGAHEMRPEDDRRMRCAFCGARFERPAPAVEQGPKVIIRGNAKVHIGKSAHVEIRGGLAVQDGATLEIEGDLKLLEPGDAEKIKARQSE